jgi:pilus assembly protein CpaB
MKQHLVLVISILIGVLAFGMTHRYLRAERERLWADAEKVVAVVAARDLPAGTVLKIEDLARKTVFRASVIGQAVRPEEVDAIVGKRLRFEVQRHQPIPWSYVDIPEGRRFGLAPTIQTGMRALSLSIGGDAAVSGLVAPNDRVDILGTFTMPSRRQPGQMEAVTFTLLQDVSVLATGQRLARTEMGAPVLQETHGSYSTVTFEVTPREAELLVFAQHMKGQLTLTLRNPDDIGFEREVPEVNFEYLERVLPDINIHRQRDVRHKREL